MGRRCRYRDGAGEQAAVKADDFVVMVRGSAEEMGRAKTILGTANPKRLDTHAGVNETELAAPAVRAAG